MESIIILISIVALWGCSLMDTTDKPSSNAIPLQSYKYSNDAISLQSSKRSNNAIEAQRGKFFLIKKGTDYAAVKLTEQIAKGDGGYNYVWYWQNDGSGSFINKNAIKGKGEVFEKYSRTQKNGSTVVENIGGILHIKCENIKVQWSLDRWVYLYSPTGNVEIALVDKKEIEDIDYLDKDIEWNKIE